MLLRAASILFLLACVLAPCADAQTVEGPRVRVAVLDFGQTETGQRAAQALAVGINVEGFALVDRGLSRDAARGTGYAGSLNLTLREARDLGAAIDCDFFITGDAQTLRRSPSEGAAYFESYVSIFIVSAHTGRLVSWSRPSQEAATHEAAEKALLEEVRRLAFECRRNILRWQEDERARLRVRESARGETNVIEDAPEEGSPAAASYREPAPYRRLRPTYTDEAARAGAEATVDVTVEVGADGEAGRIEVVRWAGFGLDEAVVSTVRQMHFRPATRDGQPFPVRILLRYNFRAPKKNSER
ncbi:MAG TPA: energy transducer TonB [Pyrinomonadaceae bacterium]|nr:energy transducer TonB [Pyrinomonadaceae bacterium]